MQSQMPTQTDPRAMTADQLAALGAGQVGYIRPVKTEEGTRYMLHGADGQELATADSLDAAHFAASHLEIEAVTVH